MRRAASFSTPSRVKTCTSMTVPFHARGHPQRGVLHVGGLLAEDGPQELLLRGELGLALRRDLAHEDVAGLDLGADVDDAGLVQLGQRAFADVGDVAVISSGPQLGVAGDRRSAPRCGWW